MDASDAELHSVHVAAVRYHLIVIGEAVHHLPLRFRSDDTWSPFVDVRNHLAHEYFRVDRERVIDLVGERLDHLEAATRRERERT
ncbi:MAG: HepT-like ribonuclease domain-containing protein [Gaiellales bacterium]